ncbi:MAG: T9SS type A sorting domain-containing protein [Bacteroidota bacterium]
MSIRHFLLGALLLGATSASAQNAAPETFYGQYVPTASVSALPATNGATTARNQFLGDLDPLSISFFDFESETAQTTTPARAPNSPLESETIARFDGYGSAAEIPAELFARNAAVVNPTSGNIFGTWATSGDNYLYAVGYDGVNTGVDASVPDNSTEIALSIRYAPGSVTAGRAPRAFSAFGAYISDTEAYDTIRLTLTPLGGGTPVVLDYGPVTNENNQTDDPRGDFPGNYQVSFVGFTDEDTRYERIDISFVGRDNAPVDNEAFGFDDFVVGEINQVNGPPVVTDTDRVLDQVDEPGWRLLSAPVRDVTVDDLAQQNVVLGVPAGDGVTQAQYPSAGFNFYDAYQGGTRWDYVPVPTTGTTLRPGRGFWWYWYDQAFTPNDPSFGDGTSVSVELDNFQLSATGPRLTGLFSEEFADNTNCASSFTTCPAGFTTPNGDPTTAGAPPGTITPNDDDFYMVGNPFTFPMDFNALSASGGTMAAQGFIWNPGNPSGLNPRTGDDIDQDGPGTYEVVFETLPPPMGSPDDPTPQNAIAVWNGMLIEVAKDGTVGTAPTNITQPVTFFFDPIAAVTTEEPPFHGKDGPEAEAAIRFAMFGETASGALTRDETTWIRFRDDATDGWDRTDASKPDWPGGAVGLIAPMGTRDGEPRAQAVLALPHGSAAVPLSILVTEAGTFDLVWRSAGLQGTLRDLETGAILDLSAERYTFAAEATDGEWAPRFVLTTAAVVDAEAPATPSAYVGTPVPNPANGAFHLDVQVGAGATLSVFDALGRRVRQHRLGAAETSVVVPTEGLAPGAYVVIVEAPGVRETRRVTLVR